MSQNKKHQKRNRYRKKVTAITVGVLLVFLGTWKNIHIADAKESHKEEPGIETLEKDCVCPKITPLNIQGGGVYGTSEYIAEISVVDDDKLESVEFYVNNEKVEYKLEKRRGYYTFSIPEDTKDRKIEIVAIDNAGNKSRVILDDIYVTRNLFVRLVNDWELLAELSGLLTLMGGMVVVIIKQDRNERYYDRRK